MNSNPAGGRASNKRIALVLAHLAVLIPLLTIAAPRLISAPSTVLCVLGFALYPLAAWFVYAISIPVFNRIKEPNAP